MRLRDSIHQLISQHLKLDNEGKGRMVPALLDDLRAAVTPGRNSSGGGASGAQLPINPAALDLLREIETEARRDYQEITGELWAGGLDFLLERVLTLDLAPEWDAYLHRVTLEWIDAINAMLWPVKPRRKLTGKVCPSCGEAYYGEERKVCLSLGCWDDDGNMRPIGTWDIECAGCEAGWSGDQVSWLLRALDTPDEELTQAV